jgi:tRNA(Ile)-lysidine synthase
MSNVKKYIAAISGGPDSMAMLHKYRKQIMTVCHVNYQKRDSANRDMMIVQDYCLKHKIKFCNLIVTKNIYEKYRKYGDNFQNIARLIRYDYFSKTAHKLKIQNLLVAHNKDDFIETSIMQLKRSTIALFLGIQQNSYYQDLNIYRPLITMWKKDILAYCKKNKIPYGLDETNELQLYERNKVRHLVSK